MALSKAAAHHRARIAGLSRDRNPDDPELVTARADLAVQQLADHAQRVVAGWPAPTTEQLARVAAILRSGGAA
jgi:hypothetical protein